MRCCNCQSDNWQNVDSYRIKPSGMSICKECGFVSYPDRWKSEEDMKKFYAHDYRKLPTVGNLYTGQRKASYHEEFLREFIIEWQKKEKFTVCDIGAAHGMFLAWIRSMFPNGDINGTEWDIGYKRNAREEYDIRLTDEIDTTKKYDLISLYNVAEHMQDVDVKLKEYRELLNDDGMLYIAVPQWFGNFHNAGPANCDLEYSYHPDHINVWTREIFESILKRCCFDIVKSNFTMYNPCYMCKKSPVIEEIVPFKHDYTEIKTRMVQTKKAFDAFAVRDYETCIKEYPATPLAYKGHYEGNRKAFHDLGITEMEGFMKSAMAACPESTEIVAMCADIYQRYELYERSIEFWSVALKMRPNCPQFLGNLAQCMRGIYRKTGDQKYLIEARDISRHIGRVSQENLPEMITWIYNDNSKIVRD